MAVSSIGICVILCNAGPANHFVAFHPVLTKNKFKIVWYASGKALDVLNKHNIEGINEFSLEKAGEATRVAGLCAAASVIIAEVGDEFCATVLKEAKRLSFGPSRHIAYYDNPESFVPGGYSETAAKVIAQADTVLFSLQKMQPFESPGKEISFEKKSDASLGYFAYVDAVEIARRRASEDRKELRNTFFQNNRMQDNGQKILVYMGSRGDRYLKEALPAFLDALLKLSTPHHHAGYIVVLQQHPAAKEANEDGKMLKAKLQESDPTVLQAVVSNLTTEDAQVLSDVVIYSQTSMAPLFPLAGIPTLQVGHEPYNDMVLSKKLCMFANNGDTLTKALAELDTKTLPDCEELKKAFGIKDDWKEILVKMMNGFLQ